MQQGDALGAQAAFRAVLQLDATHREALQLMTKAQRQLEARRAADARAQARLRSAAMELAVKLAREKAAQRLRQAAGARGQIDVAREQQIKRLYTKGLALYRQRQYEQAADVLQQMVLIEPSHPLVRDAQRLIVQAQTKQAELRAQVAARGGRPSVPSARVPELQQQLTAKRIELETILKYAKLSLKERNYDAAIELLQRVLAQDPQQAEARRLLERAQVAKLEDERQRLVASVERDERSMVNDVLKAQLLPQAQPVEFVSAVPSSAVGASIAKALQAPISMEFTDVPLGDVLEFIADAANVSIIPSPHLDLKGSRVSVKVTELPIETALKYLTKNASLAYRVDRDAVLIASAEEFASEPLQTRVFFLRNGLGPFALETSAVEPDPALEMQSIKELVERSIPQMPDSKLVVDERSGALIVTNTADNLSLVEQLLSRLDVTPTQVLIEARFLEVNMTELEHIGVEAVLNGQLVLDKKGQGDGTQGSGQALASGGGAKFPALSRESEGLNLTLQGVLTGTQFEAVLHLLEESKKTKTLSAPRITALNNRSAQIRVVEEFNYPTRYEVSLIQFDINGDGDFDDAGETEFANVPRDLQKRDIGILLNVTPSVGQDLKTMTLVLAPEVSSFSQFRDLGGGVTVPEFTSSQLTTSVVIEDGQTVVLGGLMKDSTSDSIVKVPWLGDLPLVGNLFRQKQSSSTRKNLLIFITAKILAPRGPTT
ncbi:MAG: hypothetical protein HY598_03600 [Candidatus Omnitrophica bacterium]|nr:hypothetical protein [Candidatus Omnitrophota bacterium]